MEHVRRGTKYSEGAPYLDGGGINYFLASRIKSSRFAEVREDLGQMLLRRARELMPQHGLGGSSHYPYLDSGMHHETVHIDGGGRWIEFGNEAHGICAFHNLDDYREHILGFELAGDMMEFLDPCVLAPRIKMEGERYTLTYPLPDNFSFVRGLEGAQRQEWLSQRTVEKRLGKVKKVQIDTERQHIELERGEIFVENGIITGKNFIGSKAIGASYILAKLVDICSL